MVDLTGFDLSDSNRRIGNSGAARVCDSPDNGRVLTEGLARNAEDE
jgi:hypothetical protein